MSRPDEPRWDDPQLDDPGRLFACPTCEGRLEAGYRCEGCEREVCGDCADSVSATMRLCPPCWDRYVDDQTGSICARCNGEGGVGRFGDVTCGACHGEGRVAVAS